MLTKINLIKSFSGYLPFRFQFLFFNCYLITVGSNHQEEGRNFVQFFFWGGGYMIILLLCFNVSFLIFTLRQVHLRFSNVHLRIHSLTYHTVVTRIKIKSLFEAIICPAFFFAQLNVFVIVSRIRQRPSISIKHLSLNTVLFTEKRRAQNKKNFKKNQNKNKMKDKHRKQNM